MMTSLSISKPIRILGMRLFFALLLGSSLAMKSLARGPTFHDEIEVTAGELAQGYLWTQTMLKLLPMTDTGITIKLPEEEITKSNVKDYRAKYENRLSLYRQAIEQKGYQNISGLYKGKTTKSCARIKSLWVRAIHELNDSVIEVKQNDISAEFIIKGSINNKEFRLNNPAAIAESSISILDSMNSEYYFRGEVQDQAIIIKPSQTVLNTWPSWAGPPSRRDLKNCQLTLRLLSVDD